MSKFLQYLNNIPQLPEEMILEIYESIRSFPNNFQYPNYEYYKQYAVTKKLQLYVQDLFTVDYSVSVHIIKNKIKIHKDFGRSIAYNYIIDNGGKHAETCFYDDNYQLIEKHNIVEHCWHRLDVSVYHNVVNLVAPRIALTITPKLPL
jgi:hypothetical protein